MSEKTFKKVTVIKTEPTPSIEFMKELKSHEQWVANRSVTEMPYKLLTTPVNPDNYHDPNHRPVEFISDTLDPISGNITRVVVVHRSDYYGIGREINDFFHYGTYHDDYTIEFDVDIKPHENFMKGVVLTMTRTPEDITVIDWKKLFEEAHSKKECS